MAKDSSPFHQTNLHEIEEQYSYVATVFGLQLPTGKILINFDQSTSFATLKQIAKVLRAEVVNVRGTWTFNPEIQTEEVGDEDVSA